MRSDNDRLSKDEILKLYNMLDRMDYEQLDALLLSVSVRHKKKYEELIK